MTSTPQPSPVKRVPPCACGKGFKTDMQRIRRTFLMKTLLFWLPLKRYKCDRCVRNRWMMS
ncbi:MAG: hypothetical protein V4456_20780 [Bacteroidota bacterium]